jgi:hypothetical protein
VGTAQLIKYRAQASIVMGRKLQCLLDRVNEPAEHYFGGAPTLITLQQFLCRDWLLVEWMVGIKRVKDVIDGMK